MNRFFCLVKFFNDEQHADEFRKGRLHAKLLSYYKTIEDDTRQDTDEGIIAHLQPGQHTVTIDGWDIPPEDMAGPTTVFSNALKSLRIFCMTALYVNERELDVHITKPALLNFFKKNLRVHEECLKFGKYAVMVQNFQEFTEKIARAAIAHNCRGRRGLVQYYNPTTLHEHFSEKDAPFRKQTKYANEKEYRFVFEGLKTDSIDIGDISDITMPIEADRINDSISAMTLNTKKQHETA